jgi:hypothetical protein
MIHCLPLADASVEIVSKETLSILYFLLPGFVTAWIFYGLTAHPKSETFERVVQALIFTVFVRAMNIGVRKLWWIWWHPTHSGDYWTEEGEFVWSLACAVVLGLIVVVCANWNCVHAVLGWLKITKRSSYPSEWFSAFNRFPRVVILHLDGERRIRGWPEEWPDQNDKGHFILQDAQWLAPDGTAYPHAGVAVLRTMIAASEVEMVEFMYEGRKRIMPLDNVIMGGKNLSDVVPKDEIE